MQITYDARRDVLYLRLDPRRQELVNLRVTDDITLDIGDADAIVGIEILDASLHVNLQSLLPVETEVLQKAA
jgi:uncharacterized protein YuzE